MNENIKICTEKILDKHSQLYKNLRDNRGLRAAFFTKKVWDSGTSLKVSFMGDGKYIKRTEYTKNESVDPIQFEISNMSTIDVIKKVVNERIIPLSKIKFTFLEGEDVGDIRISFEKDSGAWSLIGKDALDESKSNATMNFGWLDVATVIHEFGHLLGMVHEHQNIYGNSITEEKVVRDSLVISEGDILNISKIKKSVDNINSKNIFRKTSIFYI